MEHCGGGLKFLAARALAYILDEFSGALNRLPVYAVGIGDDGAGFDVWQSRERSLQQMHGRLIIAVVQHCGANVGDEILFYREIVKLFEKCQRLCFRDSTDELREGLRRYSQCFHFVSGGLEFGLCFAQNDESTSDLRLISLCIDTNEPGDRPDFRIRWGDGLRATLSSEICRDQQYGDEGNRFHLGSPDRKWVGEQYKAPEQPPPPTIFVSFEHIHFYLRCYSGGQIMAELRRRLKGVSSHGESDGSQPRLQPRMRASPA